MNIKLGGKNQFDRLVRLFKVIQLQIQIGIKLLGKNVQ